MTVTHGSAAQVETRESTKVTLARASDAYHDRDLFVPDYAWPAARTLAHAASTLDTQFMSDILRTSIVHHGVVSTWDRLIRPVLRDLGELPHRNGHWIAVERLLSRAIVEAFAAVPVAQPGSAVRTLLACTDGEQHTLPLHALNVALAEAGADSLMLGARTPTAALHNTIRRTTPTVVVIWSQTSGTADPEQLIAPLAARPQPRLVAATGPGWDTATLPLTVARPVDLTQTVALILATLDGTA